MSKKKIILLIVIYVMACSFNLLLIFVINGFQLSTKEVLICTISLLVAFIPSVAFALFLSSRILKRINIETLESEQILKQAGANHFKGMEAVGGKLVLTNQRLIFKSHKYNIQNHQEEFLLNDMAEVKVAKSMRVLENVLLIDFINNDKHKFILDEAIEWKMAILNRKDEIL